MDFLARLDRAGAGSVKAIRRDASHVQDVQAYLPAGARVSGPLRFNVGARFGKAEVFSEGVSGVVSGWLALGYCNMHQ
jgi:hypothetical protein